MRIEKLAPTGEGVARTEEGVAFIDRALPGELVETNVYERRKRFWRGALRSVLEPSADRVESAHAGCGVCDWAHFSPPAARRAKEELFLETMQRIGHLEPALFGTPRLEASEAGYRLRSRLHGSGSGAETRLGYFAPGTHRVVDVSACEALSSQTRSAWKSVEEAIRQSGLSVSQASLLENMPGTRRLLRVTAFSGGSGSAALAERLRDEIVGLRQLSPAGTLTAERGDRRIELEVGERIFRVSVDSFFQTNRHLVARLAADVAAEAGGVPAGEALDAFGGVGLFAGALLDAGHRVLSVESDRNAADDARVTGEQWPDGGSWALEQKTVDAFLAADARRFDVVVVDPPRAGLGLGLANELARRTRRLLLYVSCDPATLARDLPALRAAGLEIRRVRLYDLFAFTHRVETLVALERSG